MSLGGHACLEASLRNQDWKVVAFVNDCYFDLS